jgi:hypothetical protein
MAKKLYAWRYSEDVANFILDYQKKHKLKNVDDALKLIIQRLQYLEDLALEQKEQQAENPIEWLNQNPCPYRTLIQEKEGFSILCAEKHRLPLQACMTRQKRYLQFNRKCRPIGMEKPKKAWQKKIEPKTRTWKPHDEFEQAYYPDREDTFRDDWGDNF